MIHRPCKLTYKDGFLLIRNEEVHTVHISEIHTLIVDSTMTTVTGFLLCELMKAKVNVIFCDEKRNPTGLLNPCYGSHDTAGRVQDQANWAKERQEYLWQTIIQRKIRNQGRLLARIDPEAADQIFMFADAVEPGDRTNREGHAAKVYFNRIFGKGFNRNLKCDRNAALDYGYAILLSTFNKEITAKGYVTQLGIHHCNTYNQFNLSSDLMEPFRCLIDRIVLEQEDKTFDKDYKFLLLEVLNAELSYEYQTVSVSTAINRFVRNATEYLTGRIGWNESMVVDIGGTLDESSCHV